MDAQERKEMECLTFSDSKLDFDCWLHDFDPLHDYLPCWIFDEVKGTYRLKLYVGFFEEDQIKVDVVGQKLELECKSGVVPGKPEWSNRELKRIYDLPVDFDQCPIPRITLHRSEEVLVVEMPAMESSSDSRDVQGSSSHKNDIQEGSSCKRDTKEGSSHKGESEGISSSESDAEGGSSSKSDSEKSSSTKIDTDKSSSSNQGKPGSCSFQSKGIRSYKIDTGKSSSSKSDELGSCSSQREAIKSYKIGSDFLKTKKEQRDQATQIYPLSAPHLGRHPYDPVPRTIPIRTHTVNELGEYSQKFDLRRFYEQGDTSKKFDLPRFLQEDDRLQRTLELLRYRIREQRNRIREQRRRWLAEFD